MADESEWPTPPDRDGAGHYVIRVQGEVAPHWERELQMQVAYARTGWGSISTLAGQLPDQAALLGVLGRLAMWGYLILSVHYDVGPGKEPGREAPPHPGETIL